MRQPIQLKFLLRAVFLGALPCVAQAEVHSYPPAEIQTFRGIHYELQDKGDKTPLLLMVPGFTQHNRSLEFTLLRNHFLDAGWSVLIMNPPQHGESRDSCGAKSFRWGETESEDLQVLVDSLGLADKHHDRGLHALGFSIGAKTVLRFAARQKRPEDLRSVIAVAPPYRVGEINMMLSGDLGKPMESLLSGAYALDRSSLSRILSMILFGMPAALVCNQATPAEDMRNIRVPFLLVHGSGDWLIRSNHSVRLYEESDTARGALVILKTRTHAEDMLSRDLSPVREGLLATFDAWLNQVGADSGKSLSAGRQKKFSQILDTVTWVKDHRVPSRRISHLDHPTLFMGGNGLWYSAPREHAALLNANYSQTLADGNKHFEVDGAPRIKNASLLNRFSVALAIQDSTDWESPRSEASLSFYYPFGSFLWLRRVSYIKALTSECQWGIASADLALLLIHFQINYGQFSPRKNNGNILLSFPMISSPSSAFFLGGGYSAFMHDPGENHRRDTFHAFLTLGPPKPLFNARWRVHLQYEQEGLLAPGWRPRFSLGLGLAWGER